MVRVISPVAVRMNVLLCFIGNIPTDTDKIRSPLGNRHNLRPKKFFEVGQRIFEIPGYVFIVITQMEIRQAQYYHSFLN